MTRFVPTSLVIIAAACLLTLSLGVNAHAKDVNQLLQEAKTHCEDVHKGSAGETACKQGVDQAMGQITYCTQNPGECAFNEQAMPTDGGFLLTQRCDSINPKGDRAPGGLGVIEAPMWYGCTDLMNMYSMP